MSPSEIPLLALGIVLGTAVGAALALFARHRSPQRSEVRVTITPNAIPPRRAHTLAVPVGAAYPGPIPGSPVAVGLDEAPQGMRPTAAPNAPMPPAGELSTVHLAGTRVLAATIVAPRPAVLVGLPPPGCDDGFTTLARPRPPVAMARTVLAAEVVAVGPGAPRGVEPRAASDPAGDPQPAAVIPEPSATQPVAEGQTDPCAGARRIVDERCALAQLAREQARRAADTLRDAQRAYDVLREKVERAGAQADPRQVATAKERLHAEFRAASDHAGTSEETEAAARAWLAEINKLNAAVREALRILDAGNAEMRSQLPALDRLEAEANAARISAENSEERCHAAREGLAGCDEEQARARMPIPPPPEDPHPFEKAWPLEQPEMPGPADEGSPWDRLTGLPVIVRILGGDRAARDQVVAVLAAGDPGAEHEWQMHLARLVDAIVARAIEDGYLDLPDDDPFWHLFGHTESRDIVKALSALGFRFDGLGGFADERVPAPRDLSLAVGYAGLDRMRIRTWPRDSDIAALYAGAVVAADEWLADQAGDLSLGRMVDALGGRATDLADVWNAWGRMRPALLAP